MTTNDEDNVGNSTTEYKENGRKRKKTAKMINGETIVQGMDSYGNSKFFKEINT